MVRLRPIQLPSPRLTIAANAKAGEPHNNPKKDYYNSIILTFQNNSYIGELRQRWEEIKKLLKGGPSDAIPTAMQAKQSF